MIPLLSTVACLGLALPVQGAGFFILADVWTGWLPPLLLAGDDEEDAEGEEDEDRDRDRRRARDRDRGRDRDRDRGPDRDEEGDDQREARDRSDEETAGEDGAGGDADEEADETEKTDVAEADAEEPEEEEAEEVSPEDYGRLMQERAEIAEIHRPLGIATWASMTLTVGLGFIQYYNLYGLFSNQADNPCVKGNAIFGQGQCWGTPWPHLLSAAVTTGLYASTFVLSLLMPDPGGLDEGKSEYAENLRTHKLLRWVHFGGMLLQGALGFVIANPETFGLNRAEDYGTLQGLATLHMVSGFVTYGALTWAGALFTL